jgi:ABC-type Fe3+-hydroxamate transport system substrate-binding protein
VLRDILRHALALERKPGRVVSLVPSITESLFDLGAGDDVVAITDYCIFPPDLARPRVGGTKNPRVDEIRMLAPDLVHMNLEENLRRHGDAIAEFAPVFVTEPKSPLDVIALLGQLGRIHEREERAAELVAVLRTRIDGMPKRSFRFACPIWKSPWMWCGGDTYVSGLVETAGGENVLRDRERYPQIELAEVLALEPEVVFLPDEPYLFTPADAAAIREHRPETNVIGPFPGHLFTWHGTRTILGLEFLREVLVEPSLRIQPAT